ncbi:13258_t:CDS:2 [Funneliformis caledonium]|uniref:13258_t:CDS:1 n=1 Tax=Funneliformis caledonium TaxID=1117310 RepID=A0A9N8YUM7_9GLOM|nr:13258_t:CDS:2 [Funneliformis caledonium]
MSSEVKKLNTPEKLSDTITVSQEVDGSTFLDFTATDFERWGIPGGPAKRIEKLIKDIQGATHQPTSVENLTLDLGQLSLSGGTSNTSTTFSNLFSGLVRTVEENSKQIGLLIQIEQARNRGPILGEYEIGGSVTRANVYKNTIFENVDQEYYLVETNSYLKTAVQRWFNNLMSQFGSRWGDFVAKGTHDVGYLNGLMPDLSVFKTEDVADNACIPMLVKTILELKVQKRSTGFSNEEKGQIVDYLRVLTRQQPLRKLFAIFLSDGAYFYVMSFNRNINQYQEFKTNFRIGLRLFYTLILRGSDYVRAFGSRSVNFRSQISSTRTKLIGIRLEEFLGEGSSANVYRIRWNDRPAVIKTISDPNVLKREVEMLRFLNGSNIQNIPEYVAHDDKNIIIYPVCKRVDKRFQASHARGLLQVLERIHSLKIYHRDVRPSNIMLNTENNSLTLIDWGSAVRDPTGEVIYERTSTYASPAILNNDMGPYNPQPADDLHSFVRTIYVLLNPLKKPKNLKSNEDIMNYWNLQLNGRPFWNDMLTAADDEYQLFSLLSSYVKHLMA